MNIKIAELEISNDEKLYGTLIKDLEKAGYLIIENGISGNWYIIAKKDKE